MADRSDDIKQLFSHLGLNPGDYQEIRDKGAVTRSETAAQTIARTQAVPTVAAPAAPTRQHSPTITIAPTIAAVAAAPQPMAVEMPPPPIRQPPTIAPPLSSAAEAAARWPLLRAAVETPTRVAQIDRAAAAVEAPPQLIVQAVVEDAPTRRLFQELSRRPIEVAVDQITQAARRRWREPAAAVQAAPAETPPPSPPVAVVPAPVAAEADEAAAKSELLCTFRRLVAPERVPAQRPARLHFNYSADALAPHSKQPREENLDDIFSRISDPRVTR